MICNNNYCFWDEEEPRRKVKIPPGMTKIDSSLVKPKTYYYHYSNPESQGAEIVTVGNFDYFDKSKEKFASAYSDRLRDWDHEHYSETIKEFGVSGEQAWAYNLPKLSAEKLRQFAKKMLKIQGKVKAVRVLHWFNVSSGYSCPSIEVICEKS